MVIVRPASNASSLRDDTDDIVSIDLDEDEDAAIYLFGGWDGTNELSDFWRYSIKLQRWEIVHEAGSRLGEAAWPPARSCHQMCVDEETGDIYLLGKFSEATGTTPSDSALGSATATADGNSSQGTTVAASLGSGTGGRRAVGATPGADQTTAAVAEPLEADMPNPVPRPSPDFWVFHTRGTLQGTWERLSSDTRQEGGPDEIFDHQMVCDSGSRKMYVFGGKHYWGSTTIYPGLYEYDLGTKRWQRLFDGNLNSTGSIPSRTGHTMLFDSYERQLVIFAGQRGEAYLDDLWTYDIATSKSTCVEPAYGTSGGPDAGFTARAVIDHSRREFVLLSGLVRERSPPHGTSVKVSRKPACQSHS